MRHFCGSLHAGGSASSRQVSMLLSALLLAWRGERYRRAARVLLMLQALWNLQEPIAFVCCTAGHSPV
jgi:hypothetical protein